MTRCRLNSPAPLYRRRPVARWLGMLKDTLLLNRRSRLGQSLLLAGFLSACDAQDPSTNTSGTGAGLVEVRLVDAPSTDVTEIVVTIVRVEAHSAGGGGWIVLGDKTATIDLLELQGGTFAQLGVAQMPSGKVTQLRLYVKEDGPNYVTTPDGMHHPLTVPSGPESGIKIKAGFDWPACGVGNMTIDFDGKKSIMVHPKGAGAGDEWLLRPVVRIKSVSVTGDGCGADGGIMMPPVGGTPGVDAGVTPPMGEGNTPPVMMTPPGDNCASVMCGEGLLCYNGACVQPVD
jgi:hypothetical protein